MIAVIFEVLPSASGYDNYLDHAARLRPLLERMDGFVSIERFTSMTHKGKILSLSFWREEASVRSWREHPEHSKAQAAGRASVFDDYRLRVAEVHRDYGLFEQREQAPANHSPQAPRGERCPILLPSGLW
jgi:heme-degrading monooxygenase HmoA